MAGNDREPIGRKGRPTRPAKEKVSRRRLRDEDYDDDYEDDDEDEEPMPRKGKGKGRKPRGKRGWFWPPLPLMCFVPDDSDDTCPNRSISIQLLMEMKLSS